MYRQTFLQILWHRQHHQLTQLTMRLTLIFCCQPLTIRLMFCNSGLNKKLSCQRRQIAKQLLSVTETSTCSESVFSMCGAYWVLETIFLKPYSRKNL